MKDNTKLISYIKQAVESLKADGQFENGWQFRPSQKEAIEHFYKFLNKENISDTEKLIGFFEIPTGVGKTAVFSGIIGKINKISMEDNESFSTMIVVPTIELLEQTYSELIEVTPSLKNTIGQYGDRKKQLDNPITIITYDSWTDLLEKGTISAENTDLLISDEAHRGTSERRTNNIFSAYDNQADHSTARLAFTATSKFDEKKTVLATHHNQIYDRKLSDAVRENELASYIQIQSYIIRVSPEELDYTAEFVGATKGSKYYAMRKAAWNKKMLNILSEGKDEHTGDHLSDNQVAFYVADTYHSDNMANLLNNSPTLKQKAKEKGMKGVAVSIHSNISIPQQRQRIKDYKAGLYMAVVGDSKFKEGFNYKPMKVVFDFPRGSRVDKAQIIGRPARRWFNKEKNRIEGATIIDSIVYVGSNNHEEDEKLREQAILYSVSAIDILEDTHVMSPMLDFENQSKKNLHNKGHFSIFENDPNVEEYSTIDRIHVLHAERQKLKMEENHRVAKKKDFILCSPEINEEFQLQRSRTGLGAVRLLAMSKNIPEGLTKDIAHSIISGQAVEAKKTYITHLLELYKKAPTQEAQRNVTRVSISSDDKELMKSEQIRTGIGAKSLFKLMKNIPEGLNEDKTKKIISGTVKSAEHAHINAILDTYSSLPDKSIENKKSPISIKDAEKIQSEKERTGISGKALFDKINNPPDGLNFTTAQNIINGKVSSALPKHIKAILDTYHEIESFPKITKKQFSAITKEAKRTKTGSKKLFKQISDPPNDLTFSIVDAALSGRTKRIKPNHLTTIFDTFKGLPTLARDYHEYKDDPEPQ